MTDQQRRRAELRCSRPTVDMVQIELAGSWRLQDEVPALTDVEQQIEEAPRVQHLTFDTTELTGWDSSLVTFVLDILDLGARRQTVVDQAGLPSGLRRLVHLGTAVPERQGVRREESQQPFMHSPEVKGLIQSMSATAQIAERSVHSVGEQRGPVADRLKDTVGGREYEALAVAMNQLIESLSRALAVAIQRLASRVVVRE
jgi:hypothetical protein